MHARGPQTVITLRKADERSHVRREDLETWRTFDDGNPSDLMHGGFRTLESLDEMNLAPGASCRHEFPNETELLTLVRRGTLLQETGGASARQTLETGDWSHLHLRGGSVHHTLNGSPTEEVRIVQCGIFPNRSRLKAPFTRKRFPLAERRGILRLILSPDGVNDSLRCRQDARVYSTVLDPGQHVIHELAKKRGAWLHVVNGAVRLIDRVLGAGDGVSYVDEPAVSLTAQEPSEILLFDLA